MVRENSLWAFAIVIIFLVVVLPGLHSTANANTTILTVDNESITVDYDNATSVDPPHQAISFEPNATVYNASDVELENGTDYEWRPSDGTVEWFDTARTTDGEVGAITYEFHAQTQTSRDIGGVLEPFGGVLALLVLVAGVGAAIRYGTGGW